MVLLKKMHVYTLNTEIFFNFFCIFCFLNIIATFLLG